MMTQFLKGNLRYLVEDRVKEESNIKEGRGSSTPDYIYDYIHALDSNMASIAFLLRVRWNFGIGGQ